MSVCLLAIAWRQRLDHRLVLAANRDESWARPFAGPEWLPAGGGRALAPRDLRAGGSWLGVSDRGLVVAITNRPDGDADPGRPSRGGLVLGALAAGDARAAGRWIEGETGRRRYDSFNLFYADRRRAYVTSWNGALVTVELEPGIVALSNDHGLGELRLDLAPGDWEAPLDILRARLVEFLSRHEPVGDGRLCICKHGEAHGTVCASLVWLPETGPARLDWAPGPPCRTPFETHGVPLLDAARLHG